MWSNKIIVKISSCLSYLSVGGFRRYQEQQLSKSQVLYCLFTVEQSSFSHSDRKCF